MSVIQIPGGTATLRDALVSERHFELIEAAGATAGSAITKIQAARGEDFDDLSDEEQQARVMAAPLSFDEALSLKTIQKAAIVAFLERWSLKQPIPTMETVSDLPRDLFRVLAAAVTPGLLEVMGTMGETDFSQAGSTDERGNLTNATPTDDSASSATPSPDEAESTPIPMPSDAGGSIAIGASTT